MEEFLIAKPFEEDLWFVCYLALTLECDVPILEAYWHNCHKETCMKWNESTKSFHNVRLSHLLVAFFSGHIIKNYPTWLRLEYHDALRFERDDLFNGQQRDFFEITGNENANMLKLTACTPPMYAPIIVRASFAVQWGIDHPRLAVCVDDNEWKGVVAGEFLPLLECQIARLIKIFRV
jgi:hypothetical protein